MKNSYILLLRYLIQATLLIALSAGCSSKSSADAAPGNNHNSDSNNDDYIYLYVSADGKLCTTNLSQETIPVADISVVLSDALGNMVDSVRTNAYGRFLIEHNNVNVGFARDQHVYIDIIDNRPFIEQQNRFKPLHIIKEISNAPNNIATLSLDEILLSDTYQNTAQ